MIKPPDSNPDSDPDTPPHSKPHTNLTLKPSKGNKYKPNIKFKILSTIKTPCKDLITTPQLLDNNSPPFPHYSIHNTPPNNLSPRHSYLPSLFSPPCIHKAISPKDTNFDNYFSNSPIHNV